MLLWSFSAHRTIVKISKSSFAVIGGNDVIDHTLEVENSMRTFFPVLILAEIVLNEEFRKQLHIFRKHLEIEGICAIPPKKALRCRHLPMLILQNPGPCQCS